MNLPSTGFKAVTFVSVPRRVLLANVALLLVGLAFLRFNLSRLFGYNLTNVGELAFLASAGGLSAVPLLLPAPLRARLWVQVRRLVGQPSTLVVLASLCITSALATVVSPYEVRWVGADQVSVKVNGQQRHLTSASLDPRQRKDRLYGFAGESITLSAGGFETNKRLPLIKEANIEMPIYATAALTPRLADIESKLIITFFRLFDRRELSRIKEDLANIVPANDGERIALDRLRSLRDIVDDSANTASTYETKKVLGDNFAARYPGDPWNPLLQTQALYGAGRFVDCAVANHDLPHSSNNMIEAARAATVFLRGMCSMKAVTTAIRSARDHANQLEVARREIEEGATRIARTDISPEMTEAARSSSSMYEAICLFYLGQIVQAREHFLAAAKSQTGGQRARALSNAGFTAFVLGQLREARDDYNDAYEAQPEWPYIRANIAYLDIAEGRNENAVSGFKSVADDPDQRITSPQDVRLAQIMLLELQNERGASLADINRSYAQLLHEKHVATWDFVIDPELRYAFLMNEVANNVYLDGDYMGLEMFALAHVCKAGELASRKPPSSERDRVLRLLARDYTVLASRVSSFWLQSGHTGWFAHLNRCSKIGGKA